MAHIVFGLSMFVFGAGLAVAAYFAVTELPGLLAERRLNARLEQMGHTEDAEKDAESGLIKGRDEGPLPAFERMMSGTARGSAMSAWVEQSGVKITLGGLLIASIGAAIVGGFLAATFSKNPLGWPMGLLIGLCAPVVYVKVKRTRRLRAFEEMFPEALDLIARALKAGHAFATGLKMAADEMQDPVGPEFRKTFDEQNFGLPLKDALNNLTVRMPLLDVRFFATAVLIQRETGGNLSEILENLAHVVRERFKILRQVRVYTAHGRLTGYVLLGLPVFLVVALSFINPDQMHLLFQERMGRIMLMGACVMQTVGFFWIKHVIKIEV
jgi:tight adherence protein B